MSSRLMSDSALAMQLDELVKRNEALMRENAMMQSYYERVLPGGEVEEESKRERKRRGRRVVELTIDQKNEMCNAELEDVQNELEETKVESDKLIDTLKAVLEETDVRIAEMKKDVYEFKRDIVVGAENFRTGKIMAEKVTRYMEEKLRQKDAVIEKLRMKNSTLKTQIGKVTTHLKQKEEMGDQLHFIDFHQLQIENKQYMAKIEERNSELLTLKMTTGRTVQVLNSLKKKLNALMAESDALRADSAARKDALARTREDSKRVGEELSHVRRRYERLKLRAEETTSMPKTLDYVRLKATCYELQSEVKNWERKVEIAAMSAKRHRAMLRRWREERGIDSVAMY
eukprot:PLAT6548.1.p2 GENE.PLAT6548.1~~PLAT6548.1.p2  ORF type:complete len:360 (+),score=181.15 PLAT6548.1:51-1082(+)